MSVSELDKSYVKSRLDEALSVGRNLGKGEIQYFCPFCSHHKPKLQVNLETQKWRCWVCNSKGIKISTLLRKLHVDYSIIDRIKKIYGDTVYQHTDTEEYVEIRLPQEYLPILENQHIISVRIAYMYLKKRGITDADIRKHFIGYCETGLYKGRIIIPSYDAVGKLNFFITRTIHENEPIKYKNPPISRNIIGFESQINWKMPVTLCEGAFDAIAIKRNAIPIFGKTLSQSLIAKLLTEKPPVNIVLDNDALEDAIKHYQYLTNNGIDCNLIKLKGKDPSQMGFKEVTKQIQTNVTSSFEDLIKLKLSL